MAKKTTQKDEIISEKGSGNVYRDLGFPNPEELGRKANLVSRMGKIIKERGLTQTMAAELMHVDQSDLSKILRGQFHSITLDKLLSMLVSLGEDVIITVHTKPASENREASLFVAIA